MNSISWDKWQKRRFPLLFLADEGCLRFADYSILTRPREARRHTAMGPKTNRAYLRLLIGRDTENCPSSSSVKSEGSLPRRRAYSLACLALYRGRPISKEAASGPPAISSSISIVALVEPPPLPTLFPTRKAKALVYAVRISVRCSSPRAISDDRGMESFLPCYRIAMNLLQSIIFWKYPRVHRVSDENKRVLVELKFPCRKVPR